MSSAPHPVLCVFLKSGQGVARTTNRVRNMIAPHSVLRVFLKSGAPGNGPVWMRNLTVRL